MMWGLNGPIISVWFPAKMGTDWEPMREPMIFREPKRKNNTPSISSL